MNKKAYIKNVIRTTLAEAYEKQASLLGKNKDSYSLGEGITDATLLGAGAGTGAVTARARLLQRMGQRANRLADKTTNRMVEAYRRAGYDIGHIDMSKFFPDAYTRFNSARLTEGAKSLNFRPDDLTSNSQLRKAMREGDKTVKMPTRLAKLFRGARNRGALIGGGVVGAGVLANRIFNRD